MAPRAPLGKFASTTIRYSFISMMTLLQWPASISPSRNHTPGATRRMTSGLASDRDTKSASPASTAKPNNRMARILLITRSFRNTLHPFPTYREVHRVPVKLEFPEEMHACEAAPQGGCRGCRRRKGRWRPSDRRAVHDEYGHGGRPGNRQPGDGAGPRGLRTRARHRQYGTGRGSRSEDRGHARQIRRARSHHR